MRAIIRLLSEFGGVVFPLVAVLGGMTVILYLLGNVGRQLPGESSLKECATIEEVEHQLGLNVLLPSYFPETLRWPAGRILARREPEKQVVFVFTSRKTGEAELVLVEQFGGRELAMERRPEIPQIARVVADSVVWLGEEQGRLVSGWSKELQRWNQLTWWRNGVSVLLITSQPFYQLMRIAKSLGH